MNEVQKEGDSVIRQMRMGMHRSTLVMHRSTLVLTLFLFYLIGTHLRLSIYSGGSLLMPMYPMLLSATMLALLFIKPLLGHVGKSFLLFTVFVLTQPMLTQAPESISIGTFLGSLQLLVSVISALAIIYALTTVDQIRLRRFLILIWCVVIVLAIFENSGLKPVFDQVRDTIYSDSGRFVYHEAVRDLQIYGQVRATALASEPSFLADTLSGLMLMIFFLDPQRGNLRSWIKLGMMVVISFSLSPSLKMTFYLLAVIVWQFWPRNQRSFILFLGGFLLLGVLLLIFVVPFSGSASQIVDGHLQSGSFYGRIAVGPSVGWDVLTTYPIYGYGVGNEEGLYPVVAQAWEDSGAFRLFPWYLEKSTTDLMTNGFWWQWVFLGLGGGLVFTVLIMRLLTNIGVDSPFRTIVCVWIVWYAGFAFVDPLSWFIVVIFSIGTVAPRSWRTSTSLPSKVTP